MIPYLQSTSLNNMGYITFLPLQLIILWFNPLLPNIRYTCHTV